LRGCWQERWRETGSGVGRGTGLSLLIGGHDVLGPLEFLLGELCCSGSRWVGFIIGANYNDTGGKIPGFLGSRDLSILRIITPETFGE